jgi:hypothetical protein
MAVLTNLFIIKTLWHQTPNKIPHHATIKPLRPVCEAISSGIGQDTSHRIGIYCCLWEEFAQWHSFSRRKHRQQLLQTADLYYLFEITEMARLLLLSNITNNTGLTFRRFEAI